MRNNKIKIKYRIKIRFHVGFMNKIRIKGEIWIKVGNIRIKVGIIRNKVGILGWIKGKYLIKLEKALIFIIRQTHPLHK